MGDTNRFADPASYDPMAALREWHTACGERPLCDREPHDITYLANLRRTLIIEEFTEVVDELSAFRAGEGDYVRLAKELADLLYVVYGTADLFCINLPEVFKAVHANNMTKVNPETGEVRRRVDGKILKPEGYKPLSRKDIEHAINT